MRKLVAYELVSLDGVAEHPRNFITEFDDTMSDNLERVIASQDTVLLGRQTYDDWAAFWPGSDVEPFSSFINPVEKLVATSTPLADRWTNAAVLDGDLDGAVRELKGRSGGDIGLHGSISLTQALLTAGLVDELRLVVAPAVNQPGRKLFEGANPTRLELTRYETTPSGYLLLDYRVST